MNQATSYPLPEQIKSNIFAWHALLFAYLLAMIQKTLPFVVLLSAAFTARAQVDTVRASTLPGPQLAEKAYNSGLASFNSQSYPAALASFDQAIAAKPDFAAALNFHQHERRRIPLDRTVGLRLVGRYPECAGLDPFDRCLWFH